MHRCRHRQHRRDHRDSSQRGAVDDMKILVINSGSSSIKYELFDMTGPQFDCHRAWSNASANRWAACNIWFAPKRAMHREEIRAASSRITAKDFVTSPRRWPNQDWSTTLENSTASATESSTAARSFANRRCWTTMSWPRFEQQSALAPLHNPANLLGIAADFESVAPMCLRSRSSIRHFIRRFRRTRISMRFPTSTTRDLEFAAMDFMAPRIVLWRQAAAEYLGTSLGFAAANYHSLGQWCQCRRHRSRQECRYFDGTDTAGGFDDGDAEWRHRPRDPAVSRRQ